MTNIKLRYFFSVLILMCIFKIKRNIYHLLIDISWPTIQLVSSCHFQLRLTRWCGDYEVPLILGYCLEMTKLLQKKSRKIIHKTRVFVFYFKDANSITNFTIIFIILFISNKFPCFWCFCFVTSLFDTLKHKFLRKVRLKW